MTDFSTENDFLTIVDKCETLKWLRPQSDGEVTIPNALCLKRLVHLDSPSSAEREKSFWIIPKCALANELPFAGDILTDTDNHTWRIDEVEYRKPLGCWKCGAVNLTLRHRLEERVDWYRPRWTLNENGTPSPNYHLERPGIAARIVAAEDQKFELFFVSLDMNVTYRDCFMTPDNRGFRVMEFYPAKSWNELSRVVAERISL